MLLDRRPTALLVSGVYAAGIGEFPSDSVTRAFIAGIDRCVDCARMGRRTQALSAPVLDGNRCIGGESG